MSAAEFTTANGTDIKVELVRNQKLSAVGKWIDSAKHTLTVTANGQSYSFDRAENDPEHGYSLKVGPMGKATVPVPDAAQKTVKALVAEYREHNQAVQDQANDAEAAYQAERAKIEANR